jgi:ketosteroid isomerase-like protein
MNLGQIRVNINDVRNRLKEAVSRAETPKIASFYADDAVALPPSGRIYRGKADIQSMWKLMIANGLKEFNFSTLDLQVCGDAAYAFGHISVDVEQEEGRSFIESAKYVAVWRRFGDVWKIHRHIWNTNAPPE